MLNVLLLAAAVTQQGVEATPISEDNYSFPMQVTAQKRFVTVFA